MPVRCAWRPILSGLSAKADDEKRLANATPDKLAAPATS